MISLPVEVFTDGSSLLNGNGPSGWAYIIRYYDDPEDGGMPIANEISESQGYRASTNNRMEIMAMLFGLRKVNELLSKPEYSEVGKVDAYTDSEYVAKAISAGWLTKWAANNWVTSEFRGRPGHDVKNRDLWEAIIAAKEAIENRRITLTINWIRGHDGNEYNEKCDQMARAAANGELIKDEEYEKMLNNRK